MNLAFSTRGWRDEDWMTQLEDAYEMQFRGVEVYNLHRIGKLTDRGGPFHKYNRNETDRILQEHIRKGSLREQNPDQRST